MLQSRIVEVANMAFNACRENKILAKIFELSTVVYNHMEYTNDKIL